MLKILKIFGLYVLGNTDVGRESNFFLYWYCTCSWPLPSSYCAVRIISAPEWNINQEGCYRICYTYTTAVVTDCMQSILTASSEYRARSGELQCKTWCRKSSTRKISIVLLLGCKRNPVCSVSGYNKFQYLETFHNRNLCSHNNMTLHSFSPPGIFLTPLLQVVRVTCAKIN